MSTAKYGTDGRSQGGQHELKCNIQVACLFVLPLYTPLRRAYGHIPDQARSDHLNPSSNIALEVLSASLSFSHHNHSSMPALINPADLVANVQRAADLRQRVQQLTQREQEIMEQAINVSAKHPDA